MLLLDLPNELLCHILAQCTCKELGTFMQACTHLYTWGKDVLHKRLALGNVRHAILSEDCDFLKAYGALVASGSTSVAIRCLLIYLQHGMSKLLQCQLVCFLNDQQHAAAELLLSHPTAITLCKNERLCPYEWQTAAFVWKLTALPACIITWISGMVTLTSVDAAMMDHLFYNWSDTKNTQLMRELLLTPSAVHMPVLYMLLAECSEYSCAGYYLFYTDLLTELGLQVA